MGYIGTLQAQRLDIQLLLDIASDERVGTVHLVGPNSLDKPSKEALAAHPKITVHGPVPAADVPAWALGLDVLLSPHVVSDFTLSLDAIKSYEYLASGLPVVATPTSGFQLLSAHERVHVTGRRAFRDALGRALQTPRNKPHVGDFGWEARARQFSTALSGRLSPRVDPATP